MINVNFLLWDIMNNCSEDNIQVNHDPEVMANNLKIIIGIKDSIEEWLDDRGWDLILDLLDDSDIRTEYDAVIPIDSVISISIVKFKFDDIIFSRMISFEKNPDMNGIPISAILFTPRIDNVIG